MKRQLEITEDGSHTLYLPEMDEHFHSIHGAIQESMHVFIRQGLDRCPQQEINLLEVGFGTGLNAWLSLLHRQGKKIHYYSLEKYPLTAEEYSQLNYTQAHSPEQQALFLKMHQAKWNEPVLITEGFELTKVQTDLQTVDLSQLPRFDLVYFDAFAPSKQPELWTDEIFHKISAHCQAGTRFTTYCAKGDVRRSLQKNGFAMQRLAGPPGKKQILYGEKA